MIDTSKPFFPQDFPLEEVLELITSKNPSFTTRDLDNQLAEVTEDYRIRKGGPAGIFFDLRRHIENALNGHDITDMPKPGECVSRIKYDERGDIPVNPQRFMNTLDECISLAIVKLEGNSIPDTRFVIQDYAVPAIEKDGEKIQLVEATRPCTNICQAYWDLVSQEEAGALQDPTY